MTCIALFTGSRAWSAVEPVARVLDQLPPDAVVIHGNAPGLDKLVDRLARARGFTVRAHRADWGRNGSAAGGIRNQKMIDVEKPTEAHAFPLPKSRGTWDCVRRLQVAGIPCTLHSPT